MQDVLDTEIDWYSEETATFGDRLSGAREAMGLSQSGLARQLGVKLKTLRNWEQDMSEPRANKLQMLAGVLNVSIMWLLNGEGDGLSRPTEPAPDMVAVLPEIQAIQSDMQALSERLLRLEARLRNKESVQ